jgi:hypothetical protein
MEPYKMKKKLVQHEQCGTHCCRGEYLKWECGCGKIIFSDGGPAINNQLCGNDHESILEAKRRVLIKDHDITIRNRNRFSPDIPPLVA